MDVCVLGRTPGHIPRYMGQTSNNNYTLDITVMTHVSDSCYDPCYACYACYNVLLL